MRPGEKRHSATASSVSFPPALSQNLSMLFTFRCATFHFIQLIVRLVGASEVRCRDLLTQLKQPAKGSLRRYELPQRSADRSREIPTLGASSRAFGSYPFRFQGGGRKFFLSAFLILKRDLSALRTFVCKRRAENAVNCVLFLF